MPYGKRPPSYMTRSIAFSTAAMVFCILETALSWRSSPSSYPWPLGTITLVLGHGVEIAILIELMLVFKGFRERALFVLVLLHAFVGLLAGLMPALFEPAQTTIRVGSHVLWLSCCTISFTLVVSAVRNSYSSVKPHR
jgi:hypothetical protein